MSVIHNRNFVYEFVDYARGSFPLKKVSWADRRLEIYKNEKIGFEIGVVSEVLNQILERDFPNQLDGKCVGYLLYALEKELNQREKRSLEDQSTREEVRKCFEKFVSQYAKVSPYCLKFFPDFSRGRSIESSRLSMFCGSLFHFPVGVSLSILQKNLIETRRVGSWNLGGLCGRNRFQDRIPRVGYGGFQGTKTSSERILNENDEALFFVLKQNITKLLDLLETSNLDVLFLQGVGPDFLYVLKGFLKSRFQKRYQIFQEPKSFCNQVIVFKSQERIAPVCDQKIQWTDASIQESRFEIGEGLDCILLNVDTGHHDFLDVSKKSFEISQKVEELFKENPGRVRIVFLGGSMAFCEDLFYHHKLPEITAESASPMYYTFKSKRKNGENPHRCNLDVLDKFYIFSKKSDEQKIREKKIELRILGADEFSSVIPLDIRKLIHSDRGSLEVS